MRKPPVTATPFTYRLARLSSTLQLTINPEAGRDVIWITKPAQLTVVTLDLRLERFK